jgi:hypothetical protein
VKWHKKIIRAFSGCMAGGGGDRSGLVGAASRPRVLLAFVVMILLRATRGAAPALILLPQMVFSQTLPAGADADSVLAGVPFRIEIALPAQGFEATRPALAAGVAWGDMEVVSAPVTAGGRLVVEVRTFALDHASAPPVAVEWREAGLLRASETEPVAVVVRSVVPPDAAAPYDLTPIAAFPRPLWWLILIAALLVAAAIAAWWLLRRRSEPAVSTAAAFPALPGDRIGVLLEAARTPDFRPEKAHFVELADILRQAAAERTGIRMRERTTREILALSGPLIHAGTHSRLGRVLRAADAVKFARRQATREQALTIFTEAAALVADLETPRQEPVAA